MSLLIRFYIIAGLSHVIRIYWGFYPLSNLIAL